MRPVAAGALRADGTRDPGCPGTDRRHPGNGLRRSVLAGRRRGRPRPGRPRRPRDRPRRPATPPNPTRTGPRRAGCSTGQPARPGGEIHASRPTPFREAGFTRGGAARADRIAHANTAGDPMTGRRPSPARERDPAEAGPPRGAGLPEGNPGRDRARADVEPRGAHRVWDASGPGRTTPRGEDHVRPEPAPVGGGTPQHGRVPLSGGAARVGSPPGFRALAEIVQPAAVTARARGGSGRAGTPARYAVAGSG